jgi:HD-GYP domain-containing protein (c-di-GMP phosphodiesterase class II)
LTAELAVLVAATALIGAAMFAYGRILLPLRLRQRLEQSVRAFSRAIELRFPAHRGQTDRVLYLALRVGDRMKLSGEQRSRLALAAELRDIGLCAIPYRLGNEKGYSEWSEEEREAYARHPEISAAMLEKIPSLAELAPIVGAHHEDYEACPDRPIEARILRAASDYVWLERLQGTLPATEDLRSGAGSRFDPIVVQALLSVLTSSRVGEPEPAASVR